MIGSGNWGSVAARIVAQNVNKLSGFDKEVRMWVFEEQVDVKGTKRKLTEVINETHENVKYLPGVNLGSNLRAEPNLLNAIQGATMLVFVTPHQFISRVCKDLHGKLAPGAKAISLIKGMDVTPTGFQLISGVINRELKIDCSVLMGANIANEIAVEKFSEATVGYSNKENGELWRQVFHTPYFHVRAVNDVVGAELCGTLKNIVALGAGFVDGLKLGNNTKAAIIRIGLVETLELAKKIFPSVKTETFFESCGVADLITTCFGGRNRKCAEAYVLANGKKTFDQLEAELLGGQKLQGVLTSNEVQEILHTKGFEKDFPLFTTINRIVKGKIPPSAIVRYAELP
jgi:glycerol-3-phosphate dehydrogenase (NAD+)